MRTEFMRAIAPSPLRSALLLTRISILPRGFRSRALFPLTPTLSLGERVPLARAFGNREPFNFSSDGMRFSLSLRERVGVRGKSVSDFAVGLERKIRVRCSRPDGALHKCAHGSRRRHQFTAFLIKRWNIG